VNAKQSVEEALKILVQNQISSAPVVTDEGHAMGFVDVLDILSFLSWALSDYGKLENVGTPFLEAAKEQLKRPVFDIMNLSGLSKWITVKPDASILEVGRLLAQPHVHRVAITDPQDQTSCYGIITQSRFIQFLNENKHEFEPALSKRILEAFKPTHVEWIRNDKYLFDAVNLIKEKKVSGVAVLDSENKLLGNVSASDLKRAAAISIDALLVGLFSGIESFMKGLHDPLIQQKPSLAVQPLWTPIFVGMQDYVRKALDLLSTHQHSTGQHIHRVYVTDEQFKPLRVISLNDLIGSLIQSQIGVTSQ
jgi:CBS domain-containing protein